MAIEELLTKHIAALDRNSTALEKLLASGGKPAGAATGTTSTASGGGEKAADTKKTDTKKTDTKKADTKPKTPDEAAIRSAFGGYLSVEDKDERETRKANVKAILDHFGVSKATELPEENRAAAIGYVKQFEAGETPNFMADDATGDEGDGESLV